MKYAQFCYRLDACTAVAFMNCCEELQCMGRCRQCPSKKRQQEADSEACQRETRHLSIKAGHIDED